MSDLLREAHAVLFPVLLDVALDDGMRRFLDAGGRALLFGETGEEYASGRMSPARLARETAEVWRATIAEARARAGSLITALDADIAAVHRLQGVIPELPPLAEAQAMPDGELERIVEGVARAARDLGITMFLSPTADVAPADNPWLGGRTLGSDLATVTRLVGAYVRGCGRGGIVSALKHFPGNTQITGVPSRDIDARVSVGWEYLQSWLVPFRAGIQAGAGAVMMSPALFDAARPSVAGSLSPALYRLLRETCGFTGVAMTCDLDHRATMRHQTLEATAVRALAAGADLLLLSAEGARIMPDIAAAIVAAVEAGTLGRDRLAEAARRVRDLAESGVAAGVA